MDSNDRVCSRCGGSLINKKIWGEDFERTICEKCDCIDYGVPEKIYKVVNEYVRSNDYQFYTLREGIVNSSKEEIERNTKTNVSHLSYVFWNLLLNYDKT